MINQIKNYLDIANKQKEMVKDSFILTFSNFITAFFTFISNMIIASIFGPGDFGVYKVMATAFGITIPLLIDLGGTFTLTKYIAEFHSKKKKIGHLNQWFLKMRVVVFAVALVAILIFSRQIVMVLLHDLSYLNLIIPSIFIFIATYFLIFHHIVLGYENFKLYGFSIVFGRLIYMFLVIIVAYLTGSIYYSLFVYGFSFFIGYIVCIKFLAGKKFFKVKEKFDVKKIFVKYSLPMHIFYSSNYLALSAIVILTPFFSAVSMGYFAWSYQFYWASTFIAFSISGMLLPKISRMDGNSEETSEVLKNIITLYAPIAVIGIIGTLLFSNIFVSLIGSEYLPGLLIFKVVMIYGFIAGFGMIYVSYFTAKGDVKKVAILQLLINIVLLIIGFVSLKMI